MGIKSVADRNIDGLVPGGFGNVILTAIDTNTLMEGRIGVFSLEAFYNEAATFLIPIREVEMGLRELRDAKWIKSQMSEELKVVLLIPQRKLLDRYDGELVSIQQ